MFNVDEEDLLPNEGADEEYDVRGYTPALIHLLTV